MNPGCLGLSADESSETDFGSFTEEVFIIVFKDDFSANFCFKGIFPNFVDVFKSFDDVTFEALEAIDDLDDSPSIFENSSDASFVWFKILLVKNKMETNW